MDRDEYSLGVFIDIAKAFDTIDHNLLIAKLQNFGVRGVALKWFQNYIQNRYQYVSCNGSASSRKRVRFGVPQGSILDPLLFLIFNKDLQQALLYFLLLSDDTNISASHKSCETLYDLLNNELGKVNDWLAANKLSLNIARANYILFRTHRKILLNTNQILLINNAPVPRVSTARFLGIPVDKFVTRKYQRLYQWRAEGVRTMPRPRASKGPVFVKKCR